jgi:hypothetical protein
MSLPNFPDVPKGFTFDNAIYQILTSIAMEEIGLSHIINAEGEKLQYILGTLPGQKAPNPTIEQVLEVNQSVQEMLKSVAFNQMFLSQKMSDALKAYLQNKKQEDADNHQNKIPAREIKILSEKAVAIEIGGKYGPLEFYILPPYSTDKAFWSSSNESAATVNQNGLITGVGRGFAEISVTAGEATDSIYVDVHDPHAAAPDPHAAEPPE